MIYLAEGDKVNAALSAAAMIPPTGMAATGAKYGKKAAAAAIEAVGKKAGREAAEAGSQKAAKEAEQAAARKADWQGGGKDKGKPKKHDHCGKRSTYNKAPKKLGELNADHVRSGGALKQAAKDLLVEKGIWTACQKISKNRFSIESTIMRRPSLSLKMFTNKAQHMAARTSI